MDTFFTSHAKGDKWVPFSTALCEHELTISRDIYGGLLHLTDREKYLLTHLFRGSSWVSVVPHRPRHCHCPRRRYRYRSGDCGGNAMWRTVLTPESHTARLGPSF